MVVPSSPPLICLRPFTWLEIHADGSAFVCCPTWLRHPIGNLLRQPWEEVWSGNKARELRRMAANGSLHNCSPRRCPFLARQRPPVCTFATLPTQMGEELTATIQRYASPAPLPWAPFPPPTILNLGHDPRCNLVCASCRSAPCILKPAEEERVRQLNELICRQLGPDVEEMRLSGNGDPFAAPGYRQLLAVVNSKTFPHLQRIHLHSNGLLWSAESWQKLAHLHPYVRSAEISIDAADAATYALNRGGDFTLLQDNLSFIAGLGLHLLFSCVVQANNYRQMPAFLALARTYGAGVYFSALRNWGTWSRADYRQRAVHLPAHPEHTEFREILTIVSSEAEVDPGILAPMG